MPIDIKAAEKRLASIERQLDFATARALTWTARDCAAQVGKDMPEIFDKPTPFTQKAMTLIPAKKDSLTAYVLPKDTQAGYLAQQEEGGQRTPEPGKPILIPKKQRVNKYGNIPKGAIGRALAKDNTFFASGKDARTAHLPPGVYQRSKRSERRQGGKGTTGALRAGTGKKLTSLKLLAALEEEAQYEPRFQLHERVEKKARQVYPEHFDTSFRQALKTAR